jgi:hypothetical protein
MIRTVATTVTTDPTATALALVIATKARVATAVTTYKEADGARETAYAGAAALQV